MKTWAFYGDRYRLICSLKGRIPITAWISENYRRTATLDIMLTFFANQTAELARIDVGPWEDTTEWSVAIKERAEEIILQVLQGIKAGCLKFSKRLSAWPYIPNPSQNDIGDFDSYKFLVDSQEYALTVYRYRIDFNGTPNDFKLCLCLISSNGSRYFIGRAVYDDRERTFLRYNIRNLVVPIRLLERDLRS